MQMRPRLKIHLKQNLYRHSLILTWSTMNLIPGYSVDSWEMPNKIQIPVPSPHLTNQNFKGWDLYICITKEPVTCRQGFGPLANSMLPSTRKLAWHVLVDLDASLSVHSSLWHLMNCATYSTCTGLLSLFPALPEVRLVEYKVFVLILVLSTLCYSICQELFKVLPN